MPDSVLYIIGNGFDMHHGIHSSYKYFSVWLRQHNYELYRKLLDVCTSNDLWWNFEEALAYVDRDYMLYAGEIMLPDSWDEDKDSIADLYYAEDMARNTGYNLWDDIVKAFRKWVSTIRWEKDSNKRKLRLDTEARYITFNYTTFLESRYGINSNQILYIHGRQSSKKNPPIIGHGDTDTFDDWLKHTSREHNKYYRGNKSYLPEVEMMTSGVEEYFELSTKPVSRIISENHDFFEDLYDIEYIYVLGHSLNAVDMPYFQVVKAANDYPSDIKWYISYYSDSEKDKLSKAFHDHLSSDLSRLTLFKLEDMMIQTNIKENINYD